MIHEITGHMTHGLAETLLDKQPHWLTNTVTDSYKLTEIYTILVSAA